MYSSTIQRPKYYSLPKAPPEKFIRSRSPANVANAEQTVQDYFHWGMITEEEKMEALQKISNAKYDDDISSIMTNLRHKAFEKYDNKHLKKEGIKNGK